ncbi:MAG: CDP-alcohol phosphatidyltransferase family protein [Candidatus Melainabacteria bacterium]|nr:CDP-alcohol phosphatidyltransferase family protein [Candidatus Melainabacteria bacterium]
MKNLPNLITSVRLFAALAIIVLSLTTTLSSPTWFLPLFIAAAASDMLDGFIARKFDLCTDFGATLDSVSDMTLYAAVFVCFANFTPQAMSACSGVFAIGLIIQILHWVYSVRKHGCFPAYHSTLSRVVAYAMFFACLYFWTTKSALVLAAMLSFWILCSIEGMLITHVLTGPRSNVSSIPKALRLNN